MDFTPTPLGIDIQANTDTSQANTYPVVAALADGDFVVVWYKSAGVGGPGQGLYGQRFDASGAPLGSEFHVNAGVFDTGNCPAIAPLNDGGFVVTWSTWTGSYMEVYGQRFDAVGAKTGGEFHVNAWTDGQQINMDITELNDGGFVVTWFSYGWSIGSGEDTTTQDGSDAGVFAQRYAADGSKVGTEFLVNTTTYRHQNLQSVTTLADGSFVFAWTSSHGQDGSQDGVYGQIFDPTGAPVGGEFQINTYTTSRQAFPYVEGLADGGFVVAWHTEKPGTLIDIAAQVYAADGTLVGGEFQVNTYTSADQDYPAIVALADGGFVISWASNGQDGSSWGTYGQRFAPDGTPVGSEFLINATTSGAQQGNASYNNAPLAVLADGTLVQAWEGNDYTKIYFRMIEAAVPPPEITSDGGGDTAAVSVNENTTAVTTVAATDPTPWETVSYAITGGADAALFGIDGATGALTFAAAPDFENPDDADGDNVYEVEVSASDGHGGTDMQAISVTVGDVALALDSFVQSDAVRNAQGSVTYTLTFTDGVVDIGAGNFTVHSDGLVGASVSGVTEVAGSNGLSYAVEVSTGTGSGTLRLNFDPAGANDDQGDPLPGGDLLPSTAYNTAGGSPMDFAFGDFDGDGNQDVAIAGFYSSSVTIYHGNGDGTLTGPFTFPYSYQIRSVDVADMNGDGDIDLVFTNYGTSRTLILANDGTGIFSLIDQESSFHAQDSALGDLNGDGIPDLAVALEGNAVNVFLGTGSGNVNYLGTVSVGSNPTNVLIVDVNGDGDADLLSANYNSGGTSTISVLLGNGTGGFVSHTEYSCGNASAFMAAADVNGDGAIDLATTNSLDDTISVLLGNGDGTFASRLVFASGDYPSGIGITDLDRDGLPDLVISNLDTAKVSFMAGNGDGTFEAPVTYSAQSQPVGIGLSDLDGDGVTDVVTGQAGYNTLISVLLGNELAKGSATYTIDRTAPEISSDGGGDTALVSVAENLTHVTDVVAASTDSWDTVSLSIAGGEDAALFELVGGELRFLSAPDFENLPDDGATAGYQVIVRAEDQLGNGDEQEITVAVTNVAGMTIVGPTGGASLTGGGEEDSITGGNGPDSILGEGGNDTLAGQRGNDTISGGDGDDSLSGNVGRDALFGDGGNDVLNGNSENDTLKGGDGDDTLNGGSEDDMLYGDDGNDVLSGGTGYDSVNYRQYVTPLIVTGGAALGAGTIDDGTYLDHYQGVEYLILGSGNDTVNGGIFDERVEGGRGDDVLNGGGGNDTFVVRFGDGADYIDGGTGSDTVLAGGNSASVDWTRITGVELVDGATYSNFVVRGTAAGEALDFTGVTLANVARIEAGEGDDTVIGSAGGDSIVGGNGADALAGMAGADTLEGGAGADTLTGGADNDRFLYRSASASGRSAPDHIADFTTGDVIDLSGIDADAGTAGNQAFLYIGADPFTHVAGQLRAETVGGVTTISGDTNGDGRADLVIVLDNGHLVASDGTDFLL